MDYKCVCLVVLLLSVLYYIREVSGASTNVNPASLINGVRETENQEHIHGDDNPSSNVFHNKTSAKDRSSVSYLLVDVLVAAATATFIVSVNIIDVFLIIIGVFLSAVLVMSLGLVVHYRTGGRRLYEVPKWIRKPNYARPQVEEMQERNDPCWHLEATAAGAPMRHRPCPSLEAPVVTAPERNRRYVSLEGRLEVLTSRVGEQGYNIYEEIGLSGSDPFPDLIPLPVPETGLAHSMDEQDLPPPPPDLEWPHDYLEPI